MFAIPTERPMAWRDRRFRSFVAALHPDEDRVGPRRALEEIAGGRRDELVGEHGSGAHFEV